MFKCKYCGKEFDTPQQLGGHITCCNFNPNKSKNLPKQKQIYKLICCKCGKEYELELTEEQYKNGKYRKNCSRSCANSRVLTDETKLKISNSSLKHKSISIKICKVCGREYTLDKTEFPNSTKLVCSAECRKYYLSHKSDFLSDDTILKLSQAGLKSVNIQKETRRSKNEMYFCELCEKYFSNVLHNEPMFNGWDADIIIKDINFAILWNGKWHYEKICKTHSVKQVQNRDKIKIDNIQQCSFNPYIIKDLGKYNKEFVEKQFNQFIDYLKENNYIAD